MKKKILVIAIVACVLALSIASTSMAYFTDVEKATNVFTAGNVDIALKFTENSIDDDDANNALSIANKNVYPGQIFEKNATISNIGSENAYVAAIITITASAENSGKLADIITPEGDEDNIPVAISKFFTKLVSNDNNFKVAVSTMADAGVVTGYEVYIIKTAALAGKNGDTIDAVTLFENIVIPTSWDNKEMAVFNGLTVNVKAYATQTVGTGFENAESAIKTAFPDVFGNIVFPNNP